MKRILSFVVLALCVSVVTATLGGLVNQDRMVFVSDRIPPEVNATVGAESCEDGLGLILVAWYGEDDRSSRLEYQTQLDGQAWSSWSSRTNLVVNNLEDGAHSFAVKARDEAGNVAFDSLTFVTACSDSQADDLQSPVTIVVVDAIEYVLAGAVVRLSWDSMDNMSPDDMLRHRFRVDEADWSDWLMRDDISLAFAENGAHNFLLQSRDASGNVGETRVAFIIDGTFTYSHSTLGAFTGISIAGANAAGRIGLMYCRRDGLSAMISVSSFPSSMSEIPAIIADVTILPFYYFQYSKWFWGVGPGIYVLPDDQWVSFALVARAGTSFFLRSNLGISPSMGVAAIVHENSSGALTGSLVVTLSVDMFVTFP